MRQLAVELAKRFNGEIINGDAMQMYQGLPIVTNKITTEEQEGIPHHLLGFIALDEEPWRITLFKKRAQKTMKEIRSRGRLPILVGGTHYYTQSLLFKGNSVGDEDMSEVEESSNREISDRFPILDGSTEDMMEELKVVDPKMAQRWHPKDRRKIRRSLEIFLLTGRKASDVYAEQRKCKSEPNDTDTQDESSLADLPSTLLFWVHSDSEVLKKRLDARIDKMIDAGLSEEVLSMEKFLQEQAKIGINVDRSRGIWISIGWKEFDAYFQALTLGTTSENELRKLYEDSIERMKIATRQYAKRQVRWIRLKMMAALRDEQAQNQLYLLDGTEISRWEERVSTPAIRIAGAFLNGHELESPMELSSAAQAHLVFEDEKNGDEDSSYQRECTICNIVVTSEKQWDIHYNSRRHKSLRKRREKQEGRQRLPRSDENTSSPPDGVP